MAAAFAVLFAVAATAQGWSYLWCAPMQQARMSCCCPTSHDHDAIRGVCCDQRTIPALERVDLTSSPPAAADAPLVAILPRSLLYPAATPVRTSVDRWIDGAARAGPGRRVHAAHSVYLL